MNLITKTLLAIFIVVGITHEGLAQQPVTNAFAVDRTHRGYWTRGSTPAADCPTWYRMKDSTEYHLHPLRMYMDSLMNDISAGPPENFLWLNPVNKRLQWSHIDSLQPTSVGIIGALGYTPYNSTNPDQYVNSDGARSALSITTTGISGAATYDQETGVFNIPQYAGTATSVGITSGDITVGNSPITTSGNMTLTLPNIISAGSANNITYNAKGQVTGASSLSIGAPSVSGAFISGSAFQPRPGGSCAISVQATLSGIVGVTGTVIVSTSATENGTYMNVSKTRLLISVLGVTADMDSGIVLIPAGYWVKITTTGEVTGTFSKWDL